MGITNMSVPDSTTRTGLLMPKLQNRFRVTFTMPKNEKSKIITGNVVSVTRPTLSFDPVTLEVYNSRIYIPGKHTWNTVEVVMRDTVDGDVVKAIDKQLSDQIDMATQSVSRAASAFKFTTTIETLDGSNPVGGNLAPENILDKWSLLGCYIENVAYGNNDYASSDPVLITVTLKYDTAIHAHGNDTDGLSVNNFTAETDIAATGQGNFNTSNGGR